MPAELTQAIPVIATDAPVARHRRPCIVPALHEPGDLDVPPVARAVGVEAYRREVDDRALPLADAHAALYGEGAAQSVAIDAARLSDMVPHLIWTGCGVTAYDLEIRDGECVARSVATIEAHKVQAA